MNHLAHITSRRTRRVRVTSVGIGVALTGMLACGGRQDVASDTLRADSVRSDTLAGMLDTTAMTAPGMGAGATMSDAPLSDANIVDVLRTANRLDSASGAAALPRLKDADVRAYAQRMVRDHGAMNDSIQSVTDAMGNTAVTHPLSSGLEQLSASGMSAAGDSFDRAYLENEVMMHQSVLRVIDERLMPQASDPRVRVLVTNARRTIEDHLRAAETLRTRVSGR